jgi:hypothetical protein
VLHRPAWFTVPSWLIRLIFGEMARIVLEGQRATPGRLQATEFRYRYPRLLSALLDLLPD